MGTNTQVITYSRKRPRLALVNKNTDDDIITKLHASVVSHILSHLSTKDAFRTCILSKDWICKWTSSCNVHVEDYWWHHCGTVNCKPGSCRKGIFGEESFVNLMDRVLHSSQHHITSFHLDCKLYRDLSRLQTWISAALRLSLESFEVSVYKRGMVYPCSLLNSTSLRKLKLMDWNCTLNVAMKNCAHNLTSLYLYGINIVNESANSRPVTFTFPVLETLSIKACKWLDVHSVEIYAPVLTTFISGPTNRELEYDYSITIVAPRLATLACTSGVPEKIILDGSSIVSAILHCEVISNNNQLLANIGLRVRNLLNASTSLEELELSEISANLVPPLYRHDKLRRLTLLNESNVRQLFEFLHAAPSLKFLCMNVIDWVGCDYEAMESIPSCIISQLEEIVIRSFCDEEPQSLPQYDLVKFFLKKGEQLKNLTIQGCTSSQKAKRVKEIISTFPKCSQSLKIEVPRYWKLPSSALLHSL